jgi:hypothetical protein
LWANYHVLDLIRRHRASESIDPHEVEAIFRAIGVIGFAQMVAYWVTSVAFFVWLHRANRNLPALGAIGLKFTPGWAVGCFFVPLVNVFFHRWRLRKSGRPVIRRCSGPVEPNGAMAAPRRSLDSGGYAGLCRAWRCTPARA